jgi:protein-disulfide isomerase
MTQEAKILSIIGAVSLVIVIVAVILLGKSTPSSTGTSNQTVDPSILVRADSNQTASSSAKVTVVEFGDYQCPSCGAAFPILQQMLRDYSGRINFVFRNFPLPMHPNAPMAAEAAEAAGAQGKYWPMHDILYDKQNEWADSQNPLPQFDGYAQSLGLDMTKFDSDVKNNKYADKISKDQTDGNTLGVNATPTLYINNQQAFVGVPTYDDLKAKLDAELKAHP